MRPIITSLALSLCACVGPEGPPGPPGTNGGDGSSTTTQTPDLFESGTRIKARTTVTEYSTVDGATRTQTSFVGWFDSMRNEPCSPTLASDGKTRCLPAAAAPLTGYFVDAACTVPGAPLSTCLGADAPKYIAIPQPTTCPPSSLGAKVIPVGTPTTTYYFKSGANCTGPTTTADLAWYPPAGAEIPPTEFVEMTVTTTTMP